jgi:hypothetical protein
MAVSQTITAIGAAPIRANYADETAFRIAVETYLGKISGFSVEAGTAIPQINSTETNINAKEASATQSAATATTQASAASTSAAASLASQNAAAISAASAAAMAGAFVGTSTTSVLIGLGNKTFTTQTGEQYTSGIWMSAVSAAAPSNWMYGQVVSYSGTTLVLNVQAFGGSGSFADWNLSLAGVRGATGPTGPMGQPAPSHEYNLNTGVY